MLQLLHAFSAGVVFESGDGVSHSVPVFEGYSLPHAVQRFNLAGADVTTQLIKVFSHLCVSKYSVTSERLIV